MTVSEKIRKIDNKIEQDKALYNLGKKQLKFQLNHQEMFINMNF